MDFFTFYIFSFNGPKTYIFQNYQPLKVNNNCKAKYLRLKYVHIIFSGGDDEIDLVNNMERPHMSPQRSTIPEDLNVHYVVPRPDETKENNSEELSVYISTPNGLQKLERKSSQNSSSTE